MSTPLNLDQFRGGTPEWNAEFERFLAARQEIVNQMLGVRQVTSAMQTAGVLPPTEEAGAIPGTIMANDWQANQERRAQAGGQSEWNDLIGQAQFYGIPNPEKMPPDILARTVQDYRLRFKQNARGQYEESEASFYDQVAAIAGGLSVGTAKGFVDLIQRIPFMGDALSRRQAVQEADQFLSLVNEGMVADLPEDLALSYRIAQGTGVMSSYVFPGAVAAKVAASAGMIPAVAAIGKTLPAFVRAGIHGASATALLEAGGDNPILPTSEIFRAAMQGDAQAWAEMLQTRGGIIAAGGGIGTAFHALSRAIPGIISRASRSFGAKTTDYIPTEESGFQTFRDRPQTFDAEIIPEDEILGTRLLGTGASPAPSSPSAAAPSVSGSPAVPAAAQPGTTIASWSQSPRALVTPPSSLAPEAPSFVASSVGVRPAYNVMAQESVEGAVMRLPNGQLTPPAAIHSESIELALAQGLPQELVDQASRAGYLTNHARLVSTTEGGEIMTRLQQARQKAAKEAQAMTRVAQIAESPAVADMAKQPQYDDNDVIKAMLASNPGQINVLRNVGDVGKTVGKLTRQQAEKSIAPSQFRVVDMPDGRTDILVSDGKPITAARMKQYRETGFFEAQGAVTRYGNKVVIKKPGKDLTEVYSPFSKQSYILETAELFPGETSWGGAEILGSDAERTYQALQKFATSTMSQELAEAGLPEVGWLDEPLSSQLPRLVETFMDQQNISNPIMRSAFTNYIDQRRIADFKTLAPAEDVALAESLSTELADVVSQSTIKGLTNPQLVGDIVATKGFGYEPVPGHTGGHLVHKLSPLRVPVETEEAAIEFVRNFNADMPELSSNAAVPVEVMGEDVLNMASSSGSEVAGPSSDAFLESAASEIGRLADEMFSLPPGSTGGGASGPPVPPSAGGSGAMFDPEADTFARQIFALSKNDPASVWKAAQLFDSFWVRYGMPFRNLAINLDDYFQSVGVNKGVVHTWYSDITTAVQKMHNDANPHFENASSVVSKFRRQIRREKVAKIEAITDPDTKLAAMVEAGYSDYERAAQALISPLIDSVTGIPGSSRSIFSYLSNVRKRLEMGNENPYADLEANLGGIEDFASFAREGFVDPRELDIGMLLSTFIRHVHWNRNVRGPWEVMRKAVMETAPEARHARNPRGYMVPDGIRVPLAEWLHVVKTGHEPGKDRLVTGVRYMLNRFDPSITDGGVRRLVRGILANGYRGMIGLRPDAIFRDATQPLQTTAARIGFTPVIQAYGRLIKGYTAPTGSAARTEAEQMIQRGFDGGWLVKGMVQVPTSEIFGAMERSAITGRTIYDPGVIRQGITAASDAAYNVVPEHFREGIQGTVLDPMLWYTKLGELNRVISGEAGYQFIQSAIQPFRNGQMTRDQLANHPAVRVWSNPIRRDFMQKIDAGDDQGAAYLIANEAANLQNKYGSIESPIGTRSMTGKLGMQLGTFSQQYLQQILEASRNGNAADKVAYFTRAGAFWSLLGLATAYTGWNFKKWAAPSSLTFIGGPLLESGTETMAAAFGTASEIGGYQMSPTQRTAVSTFDPIGGAADYLNPYAGGMRTLQNYYTTAQLGSPEAMASAIITGERGVQPQIQQMIDNWDPQMGTAGWQMPATAGQQQPLQAGPGAFPGLGPSQPNQPVIDDGVTDRSRVRLKPAGYPVYDTPNVGKDGKVPTHRLDIPSGRRPGETWEQYEERVHQTPIESYGPEVQDTTRDINALEPEFRSGLSALMLEAQRQGIQLSISETYRPQARQEWLFKKGRSAPGNIVTWTLTSDHATRRAADLLASGEAGYLWIQQNAPQFGLTVLGMGDPGHVSMPAQPTARADSIGVAGPPVRTSNAALDTIMRAGGGAMY